MLTRIRTQPNSAGPARACFTLAALGYLTHDPSSQKYSLGLRFLGISEAISKNNAIIRIVLEMAELPDNYDFDQAFTSLFAWCQNAFARIEHLGGK